MRSRFTVTAIILLSLVFLTLSLPPVNALSGTVRDQEGVPIAGAQVMLTSDTRYLNKTMTSQAGMFNIYNEVESGVLIVFHDDPSTPGVDYLPYSREVDISDSGLDIILLPGSSIIIEGSLLYVDTENLALHVQYEVVDADNKTLTPSGLPLVYGTISDRVKVFDLPTDNLVAPSDSVVRVVVNSTFLLGSKVVSRGFTTTEILTGFQGETKPIDIREFSLPLNFRIAYETEAALDERLDEMNGYGFYLTKQEGAHSAVLRQLSEAKMLFEEGNYTKCFDALKRGYLTLDYTLKELDGMYTDAGISVYILITFLAAAALLTGYLLADGARRLAVNAVLSVGSLAILYLFYPGSKIIPFMYFVFACILAVMALSLFGVIFPRFFSIGSGGRVHTRNLIIPIFSIAKRSLRRRRLRFILTLVSITLLVTSFVALTSFSEGYGLIKNTYSKKGEWKGVSIREGSWTRNEPMFMLLSEAEREWITSNIEVEHISAKAENHPQRRPYIYIMGEPVMGVIGVDSYESDIIDLEGILIQGSIPNIDGVLIPRSIAERLALSIGDIITVSNLELEVQGIFNEDALDRLTDLDGTGYAPDKWVNTNPEGEVPHWEIDDCEGSEVVILNTPTALKLSLVGIQRVATVLREGVDPMVFAERLALERGYKAYASTSEAYITYRLGNYFEGRGITLLIPWVIVVLNVVVTMLNSLYERRGEIEILSSVGLNPAQVSAIFVAEAFITGFIAGGLGYLLGLSLYKGMAFLNIGLQVHQKVSAVWSVASVTLAISAVLAGAYTALRNSVVITPSLMRRWKIDKDLGGFQQAYQITIPLKLESEERVPYIEFIHKRLKGLENHPIQITSSIKLLGEGDEKRITFVYKMAQSATGNFYSRNELKLITLQNGEYGATLESLGDPEWVHVTGSLIRKLTMEFSTKG